MKMPSHVAAVCDRRISNLNSSEEWGARPPRARPTGALAGWLRNACSNQSGRRLPGSWTWPARARATAPGAGALPSKSKFTGRRGQDGSAVVLVLVLAFVMGMLISDNGLVLHQLKEEMKLVEKKQLQHHEARLIRLKQQPARTP